MKMKITPKYSKGREHETLVQFDNARFVSPDLLYPNVYIHSRFGLVQPLLETVQSTGATTMDVTEMDVPEFRFQAYYEKPVFFFLYNTDNYFHFLYDALPTLAQYLRMDPCPRLLMNPRHEYPFVTDCLRLLGIDKKDIRKPELDTLYGTLLVASSPTHEGCSNEPPSPEIWEVYNAMKQKAFETPIETPKKFYVSRRSWIHGDTSNIGTDYTLRRKMLCEDELVDALKASGYAEVFCENLTMAEKIQYFANATHVVGAIGGGMCNLVFASPSCKVVCIGSPEFESINRRFLFPMAHTDLTMFRDTRSVSNLYRRVKADGIIGEVIAEEGDDLILSIGNGVTWNNAEEREVLRVSKQDAVFLDKGLNSPWNFSVKECMKLIQ
jgi:hypothetical protein